MPPKMQNFIQTRSSVFDFLLEKQTHNSYFLKVICELSLQAILAIPYLITRVGGVA